MTDSTGILGGCWTRRVSSGGSSSSARPCSRSASSRSSPSSCCAGTSNAFPDTISNQPAKLAQKEKTVPVTKQQVDLMRTFIKTAVARKRLGYAYSLVDADLKGTMTLKQWETGEHPGHPVRGGERRHRRVHPDLPLPDPGALQRRPDPGRSHAKAARASLLHRHEARRRLEDRQVADRLLAAALAPAGSGRTRLTRLNFNLVGWRRSRKPRGLMTVTSDR